MRSTKAYQHCMSTACLITLALVSGCAGPLVRSQRLPHKQVSPAEDHADEPRQRLRDLNQGTLPYVAGPFLRRRHHRMQYVAEQATIKPPSSKFHPVPTRPVFQPRGSYSPPRPMVNLVPMLDPHRHPHSTPETQYPDIGLPPTSGYFGDEAAILGPVESYQGESIPLVAPNE